MKKIGIITLNGNINYGNKLQNYALLKYLQKKGYYVETIWFEEKMLIKLKKTFKNMIPSKTSIRKNRFEKFTKKFLNRKYYHSNKIENLYDYFIVGSDQVWNYRFNGFNSNYFLEFSKKINKNIAYSASFGLDEISNKEKQIFINGLNNFRMISVREYTGKKIIKDLIDKEVEVLVDPTMLLKADEWNEIVRKPKQIKKISKKYILKYFLGEVSEEKNNYINKIANENNCEIIDVYDKNNIFFTIDPSEFLYLEKNAQLICTDSFHSTVFAILFSTPFITFDREEKGTEGMNSRIDTLLKKFNLENRFYKEIKNNYNMIFKCNFENIKEILKKEKNRTDAFFNKAFK